jgi:hypothetical protein
MSMATIYVGTSVWSHAFAEDAPDRRAETLRFFRRAPAMGHTLFVSDVVLREIARAEPKLARRLHSLIEKHAPEVLDFDDEADRLAERFLGLGVVPPSKTEDAQHVAVAIINAMDILVSWNYRHLVNIRRVEAFRHASALCGYYGPPHIVTPPEVIYEGEQGS